MGVHDELAELVATVGPGVLEDPDSLRASLDDFLDAGAATSGEINLIIDAVRLGAFRRLVGKIAHGADPALAVEAAGDDLARDRGTAESAGARWAVAALGFAVGSVPDAVVVNQADAMREAGAATSEIAMPPRPVAPSTVVRDDPQRRSTLPDDTSAAVVAGLPGSSRRGRLVALALALVVLLAGAGLGIWALADRDGDVVADDPSDVVTGPVTTTVDPSVEDGVRVERSYRLDDGHISSTVTLTNTTKQRIVRLWAEVVPKQLAEIEADVTFAPAYTQVIEADPIVYWRVPLKPGQRRQISWTTARPADLTPTPRNLGRAIGWHRQAIFESASAVEKALKGASKPGDTVVKPKPPEPEATVVVPTHVADPTVPTSAPTTRQPGTTKPSSTPKALNRAPRLTGLSRTTTGENVTFSATVRGSDPDGDSWYVVSASGAGVSKTGSHSIGGFISRDAATNRTSRSTPTTVGRTVTITVSDGRKSDTFRFTLTVTDTHLAMPSYVGKYGNEPGIDIGAHFHGFFNGCLDTSGKDNTIKRQTTSAGTTVAWGSSQYFTYVHTSGSYDPC